MRPSQGRGLVSFLLRSFGTVPKQRMCIQDGIQIATPINPTEGRLLAGLRIILAVIGRDDLTFKITDLTYPTVVKKHIGLLRESEIGLKHGSVANSWKPTNLGYFYHKGEIWKEEEAVVRASFEWDGDL